MFYKKAGLKTFALITGKHLRWSLFLIVLQAFMGGDLQAFNLLKTDFFVMNAKMFKTIIYSVGHETIYFKNISERLLLKICLMQLFLFLEDISEAAVCTRFAK